MDTLWALRFLFTILLLLIPWLFYRRKGKPYSLPPSTTKIPFLGPLLWLAKPISDILPILHGLRAKHGPVVMLEVGPLPAVVVTDRHLAYEALVSKGAVFSDRQPVGARGATAIHSSMGHTVVTANGPVWRALRRNLVSSILQPSSLRSFSDIRKQALRCLTDDLRQQAHSEDGVIQVSKTFRQALFRVIAQMCFGENIDNKIGREIERIQDELAKMALTLSVFDMMPIIAKILLWSKWQKFLKNRREQEEIMQPFIASRRQAKAREADQDTSLRCYLDSLLDLEIPVDGGRKLHDDEIISLCSEMINASMDTTIAVFEWIMAQLVRQQDVQNKLYREINAVVPLNQDIIDEDLRKMPYLTSCILEGLRRHPPALLVIPHVVSEDASLGGYTFPKGSTINFYTGIGLDGEVWEEPSAFKPERFLNEEIDISGSWKEMKMMPFGAGRRICPGISLSMLHLQYYLANLIREFEWNALDGEDIDMTETVELAIVMKYPLRAKISPRSICSLS